APPSSSVVSGPGAVLPPLSGAASQRRGAARGPRAVPKPQGVPRLPRLRAIDAAVERLLRSARVAVVPRRDRKLHAQEPRPLLTVQPQRSPERRSRREALLPVRR